MYVPAHGNEKIELWISSRSLEALPVELLELPSVGADWPCVILQLFRNQTDDRQCLCKVTCCWKAEPSVQNVIPAVTRKTDKYFLAS